MRNVIDVLVHISGTKLEIAIDQPWWDVGKRVAPNRPDRMLVVSDTYSGQRTLSLRAAS